jgi:magnesium-transporting ATPase (P-type)
MLLQNKIVILLIIAVAAISVYLLGDNVFNIAPQDIKKEVSSARDWLIIISVIYVLNFIIAWLFKGSWSVTLGRMLVCGFFGYIVISEFIDIAGQNYNIWGELLKGEGSTDIAAIKAIRYTMTAWIVSFVMTVICIGVGFESEQEQKDI